MFLWNMPVLSIIEVLVYCNCLLSGYECFGNLSGSALGKWVSVYADTGDLTGSVMPVSSQVYACMNRYWLLRYPKIFCALGRKYSSPHQVWLLTTMTWGSKQLRKSRLRVEANFAVSTLSSVWARIMNVCRNRVWQAWVLWHHLLPRT